jgi:hypothetical protein
MDTLLDKLRAGDTVGKKNRRNRGGPGRQSISSTPGIVPQVTGGSASGEAADIAKDMLAALKHDGPSATLNVTSSQATKPRRSRLRGSLRGDKGEDTGSSVDLTNYLTEASIPEDAEDEEPTIIMPTSQRDSLLNPWGSFPSQGISSRGETTPETKELPQLPR